MEVPLFLCWEKPSAFALYCYDVGKLDKTFGKNFFYGNLTLELLFLEYGGCSL